MTAYKKEFILTLLLSVLLSVIFIYKLIPHYFDAIPYTHNPSKGFEITTNMHGDHLQWLYHLALLQKAIEGKTPLFSDGFQFSTPYKASYINMYFPPQGILFRMFSGLGIAGAYNTLIILALIISLVSTYYFLKNLKLAFLASFTGSVIFTFFPYHISSLYGGHPAGMMISYIPLFLLCFEKTFTKNSLLCSFVAGLLYFFFSCSEPHYHYYLFILMPVYLLFIYFKNKINPDLTKTCDFLTIPFSGNKIRKTTLISALLSLMIFFISYAYRHNGYATSTDVLQSIATSIFLCYSLIFFSYIFYNTFIKNPAVENFNNLLSKSLLSFNLLYFYFIQYYFDIPNLAFYLFILVLLTFFFPFIKQVSISTYFHKILYLNSCALNFIRVRRNRIIFLIPLILGILFSIAYTFHFKTNYYGSSTIEKGRDISEIKLFSPMAGDLLKFKNSDSSKYVYPGFSALLITLGGFIFFVNSLRKKASLPDSFQYLFYLGIFIFTFILSFGPNISSPPLFQICRKLIPYFDFIRSPIKLIIFSSLALSAIVAITLNSLKNKRGFSFVLALFIICEYLLINISPGICKLKSDNNVLDFLKNSKSNKNVLYLPLWPGNSSWESLYQYYSILTDKNMINGYQPAVPKKYVDNVANPLYSLNFGQITNKQFSLLKELNVEYLVFHKEAFPRQVSPFPQSFTSNNLQISPYLEFLKFDDPLYLFSLKDNGNDLNIETYNHKFGYSFEGEFFRKITGSVETISNNNYSYNKALRIEKQASVCHEKYFPQGHYKGSIKVYSDSTIESSSINLMINDDSNQNIIILKEPIQNNREKFTKLNFEFMLQATSKVSFVLTNNSSARFDLDYLYVIFKNQNDPLLEILPGDGIFIGKLIKENQEEVCVVDGENYNPGPLISASNRLYPQGFYIASFVLKTDKQYSFHKPLAKLQVTDSTGTQKLFERSIYIDDFKSGNFEEFEIPFILDTEKVLNFNVNFLGKGKLYFKKLTLVKT